MIYFSANLCPVGPDTAGGSSSGPLPATSCRCPSAPQRWTPEEAPKPPTTFSLAQENQINMQKYKKREKMDFEKFPGNQDMSLFSKSTSLVFLQSIRGKSQHNIFFPSTSGKTLKRLDRKELHLKDTPAHTAGLTIYPGKSGASGSILGS